MSKITFPGGAGGAGGGGGLPTASGDLYILTDATRQASGILLAEHDTNPAHTQGLMFYDGGNQSLGFYNSEADVTLQLGQELWVRIRNNTGSTITDGTVVRLVGAIGQLPTVALAKADDSAGLKELIGIATHDIEHNSNGFVTVNGTVNDLDTTGGGESWSDGDSLYISDTTAGALTNVRPVAPNYPIHVGDVLNAHVTQGSILVHAGPTDVADHMVINEITTLSGIHMPNQTLDMAGSGYITASSGTFADIYADTEIYLSGTKLAQHISDISQESAVGLAVDGSNRMTGTLNGPVGGEFNIKAFANAGFDLSDAFDNSSFDTAKWDAFVSAGSSVTETTKLRCIAAGGNSRGATFRPVGGAYDKTLDIDVTVHVDPVSAAGSSSTQGILGLIGNATSNTAAHYDHGQHVDFNNSTQSIQGKVGNYNVGIRGSTNGLTTLVVYGWGTTSSAGVITLNGDTAGLAASGGVDFRVTFDATEASGTVSVRTTGVTSNNGGDWIEISGGAMSFGENPEVRMGCMRGTNNVTGDYSAFVQNEGVFLLDAGGATTNFVFQNASPVSAGGNLVEFKNNGSQVAHITADGDIHSSGTIAATDQVTISGIAVGDFLSGGAADLSAVAEPILPDTSGIRDIGSFTKVWASGFFDGIVLADEDAANTYWKITVDQSGTLSTTQVT